MKVRSLTISRSITRVLAAGSLAVALGVSGAAAPFAAWAQPTSPAAASAVSVLATVTPTTSAVESTTPAVVTTPTASVKAPVKAPAKKLTVPQLISKIGHQSGLSAVQISALLWIAKHESNFHPTSKSSSGCYGLFQLSASMVRGHSWKDATWNTKRAIKYMKGRYGGPVQAKAFWTRHHWY